MRANAAALMALLVTGCGSMERKAVLINPGDDKAAVLKVMGTPRDRQFKDSNEAWQYCQSAPGYYDYRIVWFHSGEVTGISSYKKPAYMGSLTCAGQLESVRWEDAPDTTIEVRNR
jgi:hypothetical protein